MIQPPEDLNMGHAIAYVLLYAAKYNDGESTSNEFHEILKSMKYWMGSDSKPEEIKKILIETDEWFSSGSNFERTDMLDKVINLIIKNSGENKSIVKEIFDDCLRLSASNDEKYQSVINNDSPINEDLLKSLIEEYPLLSKLHQKLNIV